MNVSRCVLITTEEHIWVNILPYLFKKREKYNWILNRPKDSEKSPNDKVEVFVWWSGDVMFSATPLRSHLKRLKQKDGVKKREECFKISRRIKTKNILKKLIDSTGTHYWDDSFIGKELSKYLEAGVLRLNKASESKVTKEPSMEVVEQQSEPQPSTSQVKVEDDEKQEDNNPRMKLSQSQVNGLILKLLSHVSVSVKSMTKDIAVLTSKMDQVTSKMDKVAETFHHKLYDPLFDDDFCMT